ncbi:MAG: hypothetical protein H0T08_08495 [Acidobacteria bacterium]|jgi:Txe/YoeB family toxin of Txe-Axe toxin-antitoxin module|nr:hypothetical protein [Acidobacteriota bacterium]
MKKMIRTCILLLVVLLLAPAIISAQTSRSTAVVANKRWQQFWVKFNQAVKKKDRVGLREMMSDDFDDHGGGSPAEDYVKDVFSKRLSREYRLALASGTKLFDYDDRPSRITKRGEYPQLIFIYSKDKVWQWAAMMGD